MNLIFTINGFCTLLILLFSINSQAMDMARVPHVSKKADDSFRYDYAYATDNRAFAIASDGAWSWSAKKETAEQAKSEALAACSRYTKQKCLLYAVNNQIVLDIPTWRQSWGPYKSKIQALSSETGTSLGQKFPDLRYISANNKPTSIQQHQGKIVFVHFWGSWCPSCGAEFTTLIDLYRVLNDVLPGQIEFIILQARESIEQARSWAGERQLTTLPLSDSRVQNSEDKEFTLSDGTRMPDRSLARAFPTSYVLDRNGINVFSHKGSIDNWTEFVPFFMDVSQRSGK